MNHALFISVEKLVAETPLNGTLDTNLAAPLIKVAQDAEVWPTLGTDLYDKLKADVIADTLTGDYQTLMETYIQPCLVWFSLHAILPHLRVRMVNNALQVMSSEQSSPAEAPEVRKLADMAKNYGHFYRERLIDHLCHNTSLYPEYNSNTGDDIHPRTRNYTGGLYLGNTYSTRRAEDFLRYAGFKVD